MLNNHDICMWSKPILHCLFLCCDKIFEIEIDDQCHKRNVNISIHFPLARWKLNKAKAFFESYKVLVDSVISPSPPVDGGSVEGLHSAWRVSGGNWWSTQAVTTLPLPHRRGSILSKHLFKLLSNWEKESYIFENNKPFGRRNLMSTNVFDAWSSDNSSLGKLSAFNPI